MANNGKSKTTSRQRRMIKALLSSRDDELPYESCRRLGEAVICQAIRDANCIQWRDSAEMYIGSDECRHLCDLLGLEYQDLLTWLNGAREMPWHQGKRKSTEGLKVEKRVITYV